MAFNDFKQLDFKQFDAYFNNLQQEKQAHRREATNTLKPNQIRRALRAGEIPPNMAVLAGAQENGTPFSIEDLRRFDKARQQTTKQYGANRGSPIDQLVSASRAIDIQRANVEIRSARLYKSRGAMFTFIVTASGKNKEDFYQVRVRLENWLQHMTSSRTHKAAVEKAVDGNVSFDCGCGRHQYWYRYVATVGNFAVAPYEKDFPKIRNPRLTGCCCKHVLKVFNTIKSPTVQAYLAKEMEKQASTAGFAGDTRTQFANKEDHQRLKAARPGDINQEEAMKAYQKYLKASKTLGRQLNTKETQKELAKLRSQLKQAENELKQQQRKAAESKRKATRAAEKMKADNKARKEAPQNIDAIKVELRQQLDFAKIYNIPKKTIYAKVAEVNSMKTADIEVIAKDL